MIIYNREKKIFHLGTEETSYLFSISSFGHPVHLYYGDRLPDSMDVSYLLDQLEAVGWKGTPRGSATSYNAEESSYSLHYLPLEYGFSGKGDYRQSGFSADNGLGRSDFLYSGHEIIPGPCVPPGLPHLRGDEASVDTLILHLKDREAALEMDLIYQVVEDADCIARSVVVRNSGESAVKLDTVFSFTLDISHRNCSLLSLNGAWIREREIHLQKLEKGRISLESRYGVSSSDTSPSFALLEPGATENRGNVTGVSFLYSGNHQSGVEVSNHSSLRLFQGIHPDEFGWTLSAGEAFHSPLSLLTYSSRGLGGMSRHFHRLVNRYIIPPRWQERERPVLLNSWEANYFDFSESRLLKQARLARDLGIELFVLDDGWFGKRDDDTSSLGDWTVYKKKLSGGLGKLSRKMEDLGLSFGLWFEPEMISEDSELFRKHPEYVMGHPDTERSPGRNQFLLDLCNPEVVEYLFKILSHVIEEGNLSYIKWDMNRNFSDIYSPALPREQQKEVPHRYVLGLYRLMERLTERFPDILFESCASGGNRFDAGMLFYMPQTWTSDNTDAVCRQSIQYGTSLFAPLSTMGAHVSGRPNHQVLRNTPLESRFNTASFGVLGYELDPAALQPAERKIIKKQIEFYKKYRKLFQFGDFYRIKDRRNLLSVTPLSGEDPRGMTLWMVSDGKLSLLGYYQTLAAPNPSKEYYPLPQLDPGSLYCITSREQSADIREFGDLIKEVAPINLKINGVLHNAAANRISYQLEKTQLEHIPGILLQNPGFSPKQQFYGTGISEDLAVVGDFGSRLFIFEKEETP